MKVGFATDVGLTRSYVSKLDSPYSSCRKNCSAYSDDDSMFYKYTLKKYQYYSKLLCNEFCIQYNYVKTTCKCNDPSVPIVDKSEQICTSPIEMSCIQEVRNSFNRNATNCGQYCPSECDTFTLNPTLSMAVCNYYFLNPITSI